MNEEQKQARERESLEMLFMVKVYVEEMQKRGVSGLPLYKGALRLIKIIKSERRAERAASKQNKLRPNKPKSAKKPRSS